MSTTRTARPFRVFALALLAAVSTVALVSFGTPAHATPSQAELDKQIQDKSNQFNKAVEQYNRVMVDLKKNNKKIADLQKKLKPLEVKVDRAQKQVGSIASAAYRGGTANAVNSILSNGSASTLLDSLAMLDQIAHTQNQQIASLVEAKADLDKQKNALTATVDKENKQKKDLAAKKKKLDGDVQKLRDLRTQAYGSPDNYGQNVDYGPPPNIPGTAGQAVDFAWNQLGKPYQMNAAGPGAYDCSGLTMASWANAGHSLSHSTYSQWNETARISRGDLQPGDLVFYYNNEHVAIYIGGGTVIHAPTYGEPVQKAGVDSMPANGYGRVR